MSSGVQVWRRELLVLPLLGRARCQARYSDARRLFDEIWLQERRQGESPPRARAAPSTMEFQATLFG